MVTTEAAPELASAIESDRPLLRYGAMASIGAGAIHAAAVGMHSEHRQAVLAFSVLAIAQIGWGAIALVRSGRAIAVFGAGISAVAVGGWALAKTQGISFVEGLTETEAIQWADGLAAAIAAVVLVVCIRALLAPAAIAAPTSRHRLALTVVGASVFVLALTAMVDAGSHQHDGSHAETAAGGHDDHGPAATGGEAAGPAAAVAPTPYDPELPIDLSGVPGVTPQEQARAENLIAITLARLPQFADYKAAEDAGFNSIGDGLTGHEHFINWDYIDDDYVMDPDYPESLVYERRPDGSRKLVAAMFMLKTGTSITEVPNVGGSLTQWHIHDNLCFSNDPKAPRVAGITNSGGECPGSLQKFTPVPMIHVWITPHPCGPFAALEGVGAGQIEEGAERLCDHAHGA